MWKTRLNDFPAIAWYTELLQEEDNAMQYTDQRVPCVSLPTPEEIDICGEILRESSYIDPSAGRTTLTEVEFTKELVRSPSAQLLELDSCQTMYPDNVLTINAKDIAQQNYLTTDEDSLMSEDNLTLVLALEDIDIECVMMELVKDPQKWSVTDVSTWVRYMSSKYNIIDVSSHLRQKEIDGSGLCRLSRERSNICSEQLYAELAIWCHFFELTDKRPYTHADLTASAPGIYSPSSLYSSSPSTPENSMDSSSSCSTSLINSEVKESVYTRIQNVLEPKQCPAVTSKQPTVHKQTIHLWQFLKELLHKPTSYSNCIKWISKDDGIFKIEDSTRVATEWGRRKNRPNMNYDKLSRSIRQYYKKGIIKKTQRSKRLVYQFCSQYL